MLAKDRDAVICDIAETYHIYDIYKLPARLLATFAVGLRADSRIKMKLSKSKVSMETMLLATIVDKLSLLLWAQTADAHKGKNYPQMITELLVIKEDKDTIQFSSGKDFEEYRRKMIKERK